MCSPRLDHDHYQHPRRFSLCPFPIIISPKVTASLTSLSDQFYLYLNFIWTVYNLYSCMSGCFNSALYLWELSTVLHVAIVPLFSLMYNISFILFHSLTDRHLVCFYFGDRNNTTVNIFMPVFSVQHVGLSVGHIPKRGIAQSEGLALVGSAKRFVPIYTSTTSMWKFQLLPILSPTFGIVSFP